MDINVGELTARSVREKSLTHHARGVPLLRLLPVETLNSLSENCRVVGYPKRRSILSRGEKSDWLGIVLSGSVQILHVSDEGREVELSVVRAGDFFGELAVLDGEPRSAFVVALSAVQILRIPGSQARDLIYRYPSVAEFMFRHCARRIREMTELRALQCLPHTQSRLRALLNLLSIEDGNQRIIPTLPSHRQLAFMINTSRENLCRSLSDLKKRGLIVIHGRTVRLNDIANRHDGANQQSDSAADTREESNTFEMGL